MMNKIKSLWNDEQGQGMTEYGLVLGLIAVAVVAALVTMRGYIIDLFNNAEDSIKTGVDGMAPTSTP